MLPLVAAPLAATVTPTPDTRAPPERFETCEPLRVVTSKFALTPPMLSVARVVVAGLEDVNWTTLTVSPLFTVDEFCVGAPLLTE